MVKRIQKKTFEKMSYKEIKNLNSKQLNQLANLYKIHPCGICDPYTDKALRYFLRKKQSGKNTHPRPRRLVSRKKTRKRTSRKRTSRKRSKKKRGKIFEDGDFIKIMSNEGDGTEILHKGVITRLSGGPGYIRLQLTKDINTTELSESRVTINCNDPTIRCEKNNENPENLTQSDPESDDDEA